MLKVFKIKVFVVLAVTLMMVGLSGFNSVEAIPAAPTGPIGSSCTEHQGNSFLGLPPWYKYLDGEVVAQPKLDSGNKLVLDPNDPSKYEKSCQPVIKNGAGESIPIGNILAIGMAILEILTRLAGLVAFGYLIYGGFMYLTSSGEAEQTKKAGATLLNAAIGLAIAISATTVINFVAYRLSK